jgi:tRNA threonylcarbamoyl adenosine modification protein YeaZ
VLLAFDTATPLVTVALHDGHDVVVELSSDRPLKHGEQLAPLIERALAEAGLVRQDLTAIAVGVGPGPFTGLRVGLVTARTLAFVLEIPVYGVCSLDVIAVEAVDTGAVTGGFVVATDARRKEVYLASYDEGGARLDGPVVERPAAVATDLPAAGEGAVLYPEAFSRPVGPTRPSAGWLARVVADERAELLDPEPLYLRRPDAATPAKPKPVS